MEDRQIAEHGRFRASERDPSLGFPGFPGHIFQILRHPPVEGLHTREEKQKCHRNTNEDIYLLADVPISSDVSNHVQEGSGDARSMNGTRSSTRQDDMKSIDHQSSIDDGGNWNWNWNWALFRGLRRIGASGKANSNPLSNFSNMAYDSSDSLVRVALRFISKEKSLRPLRF
jgi:hypothetical protein